VADLGVGVWGFNQNRSSLGPSLGFAAIAGTPRIENGGTFAVDFADGRRTGTTLTAGLVRHNLLGSRIGSSGACTYPQCGVPGQWRQIQEKTQDYSGFGLKLQTLTPKSA
jgi:hypothetical protein